MMVRTSEFYQNLNEYYKSRSGLHITAFSSIHASLKPISQFKSYDEIKLPFVISGRLVTAGEYRDRKYGRIKLTKEALKSTVEDWVGIHIYTSHAVFEKVMRGEDVSINEVIGKITKAVWNEKEGGIDFYAEISDKNIAFKMDQGLIKYISVGFARDIITHEGEYYFMNVEPKEASLVYDPRDKNAEFKPVDN